jgi:hypothetical protein
MVLSSDHKYVALYGIETKLSYFDTAQLGKSTINFLTVSVITPTLAWSHNSQYFIACVDNELRIFDKFIQRYSFANLSNVGTIKFVDWARIETGGLNLTSVEIVDQPPNIITLSQNYPNPFNANTTIVYEIDHPAHVQLLIIDLLGREVSKLVDIRQNAGSYAVDWQANEVASGVYFYQLSLNGQMQPMRKMLLIK